MSTYLQYPAEEREEAQALTEDCIPGSGVMSRMVCQLRCKAGQAIHVERMTVIKSVMGRTKVRQDWIVYGKGAWSRRTVGRS